MRATGSAAGTVGSLRMWSTPAPSENTARRLGKLAITPGSAAQESTNSTSSTGPVSGHTWTGTSGQCCVNAASKASTGAVLRIRTRLMRNLRKKEKSASG